MGNHASKKKRNNLTNNYVDINLEDKMTTILNECRAQSRMGLSWYVYTDRLYPNERRYLRERDFKVKKQEVNNNCIVYLIEWKEPLCIT